MSDRLPPPQPRIVYAAGHPDGPDSSGPHVKVTGTTSAPPTAPLPPRPSINQPRPMAQIVQSGSEPTRNVLGSLLPRDDSSTSITTALQGLERERRAAEWRRDTALANRRRALTDSRAAGPDIEAYRIQADEAALELERLEAVRPELEAKLEAALRREDAAREEFARVLAAHEALATDLAKALPGYEKAVAAVVRIAEMAHAYNVSTDHIRRAVAIAGMAVPPPPVAVDTAFLQHLVVPARAGNERPLWGTLPPYVSTSAYARPG